jgi:hypothetical protein
MDEELIELFISYSHRDETLRQQLDKHLTPLQRQKVISTWHDRKIGAGQEWAKEIDDNLSKAHIILLLISPDFVASDYCYDLELGQALQRHERGEAIVVPVIIEPCDWTWLPFGKLQAFPKDGKAITTWSNQNEAFLDVSKGIRAVAQQLQEKQRNLLSQGNLSSTAKVFTNSAEEQYRQKVRELMNDGEISPRSRKVLDHLREAKKLTLEQAKQLEDLELESIRTKKRNLESFRQFLLEVIADEYPLGDTANLELTAYQEVLEITPSDAERIKKTLFTQKESEIQKQREIEAEKRLQETLKQKEQTRKNFWQKELTRKNLWQKVKQQMQGIYQDSAQKYHIDYNPPLWEQLNSLYDDFRSDLRSEKYIDYQLLRDLLKAKKWQEADQETYRVMLRAANRESQGWLNRESIDNFPCADLRTIDQLWIKYSQGHFGFSIQKQIWLKCGGKVDGETEKKLGDALGWRENGRWEFNIIYDPSESVLAHLPLGLVQVGWSDFVWLGGVSLCFRIGIVR